MKQENNVIMKNATGMFAGQVVFRIRKGVTVLAAPPKVNKNRVIEQEEQERRAKFKSAIISAKAAILDPVKRKVYEAAATGGQTAFNIACRDWHKAPEVLAINASMYTGQIGSIISVDAVDDVRVDELKVAISDSAGDLIEEGNAVLSENGLTWNYTATAVNANMPGSIIIAKAYDMPRNETSKELALS